MSWITIIWSISAGISIFLSLLHFTIWFRDRGNWMYLVFSMIGPGAALHSYLELRMIFSETPGEFLWAIRMLQVPTFIVIASVTLFVRLYLKAGSVWLVAMTIGLRFASVVINFMMERGINYRDIGSLRRVPFLGEMVSIPEDIVMGTLYWFPWVSFPLGIALVWQATIQAWKKGDAVTRRRARMVGFYFGLSLPVCLTLAVFVMSGNIQMPLMSSLAMMAVMAGMGIELSRDVFRASQLAQNLRDTEKRLSLASSAAKVALWEWNASTGQLWLSSEGKGLLGFRGDETPKIRDITSRLHPEERRGVLLQLDRAMHKGRHFAFEHRVIFPDGSARWLETSGGGELDHLSGAALLRGGSVDITNRRSVESQLAAQREQLAHTLRLASMNQIASSLAHELNQPLSAVTNNAAAARRMIQLNRPLGSTLSEIFDDILEDSYRAAEVIRNIRGMTKRDRSTLREMMDLNEISATACRILSSEALSRECEIIFRQTPAEVPVHVNAVHIQQVLINLLMNALESFEGSGDGAFHPAPRRVILEVECDEAWAVVKIRDYGPGLPGDAEKCFQPFHTSKPKGLGMGLAISRDIIEEHGGVLSASNVSGGGAMFQFRIPLSRSANSGSCDGKSSGH